MHSEVHASNIMEVKHGLIISVLFMHVCHFHSLAEHDILLGYDKNIISNATNNITIELFLQQLKEFDPDYGMSLSGIFVLEWVDDRLSRNDSDKTYETNDMSIDINKIWIPSLDLSNSVDGLRLDGQGEKQINEGAYVRLNGHVTWRIRAFLDPYCPSKNAHSNKQSCHLAMIAANVTGNQFDLKLNRDTFDLKAYVENYNWKLCGTKATTNKDAFGQNVVIFQMWYRQYLSWVGVVDFYSRITIVTFIAGTSSCVFKISKEGGRVELISIILIVTNLFDPNTLETAYQKVIYNIFVFIYLLLDMTILMIVLGVVKIPYDSICLCVKKSFCQSNNEKTTKSNNSLQKHNRLSTVRRSRSSQHETNDSTREPDGSSLEMPPMYLNENQETDQLENELAEEKVYDSRNFELFAGIYIVAFLTVLVINIRNDFITAICESENFE